MPDIGVKVFGGEDKACLVVDYETEKAVILPGREFRTAYGIAERINRLLAEGERQIAEEYKKSFEWLKEHTDELKEPTTRRNYMPFAPSDVPLLVQNALEDYKKSSRLSEFEKAAINRALKKLSPLEIKVFILTSVWGLSVREVGKLIGQPVFSQYNRIRRKLG
jgi:DNA-directed RNA polymerase specialized sigma24 family protein